MDFRLENWPVLDYLATSQSTIKDLQIAVKQGLVTITNEIIIYTIVFKPRRINAMTKNDGGTYLKKKFMVFLISNI